MAGCTRQGRAFRSRNVALWMKRLTASAVVVACLVGASSASSAGEPPQVLFDVGRLVACREVRPAEHFGARSDHRCVEAVFHISTLFAQGTESDLEHLFYVVESRAHGMTVVDFLPRTELASPVLGAVGVETKDETSKSIGAELSAKYDSLAAGNLSASVGSKNSAALRYEMLPPLDVLAASGTINRASGVYFRLMPSAQTSLEGAQEFVCVFRVPADWRGDWVTVRCRADGIKRGPVRSFDSKIGCGEATFRVGLYVEGDTEAAAAVTRVLDCEEQLAAVKAAERAEYESDWTTRLGQVPGLSSFAGLVAPCMHTVRRVDPDSGSDVSSPSPSKHNATEQLRLVGQNLARAYSELEHLSESGISTSDANP